jgi:hypothetical protein
MCCHANDPVPLIELVCPWCKETFCICRSCYRGHKYCSESHSDKARRENNRRYNKKYRDDEDVREHRTEYERERRRKKKAEKREAEKSDVEKRNAEEHEAEEHDVEEHGAQELARAAGVRPEAPCEGAVCESQVGDHGSPRGGASGTIALSPASLHGAVEAAGQSSEGGDAGWADVTDGGSERPAGAAGRSFRSCGCPRSVPHCTICRRAGYVVDVFPPHRGRAMWRGREARC